MKKSMSYKQRLMLSVNKAATMETGVSMPYGFQSYAIVAAKLRNKRLNHDWR